MSTPQEREIEEAKKQKKALFYLYLYHQNYRNEPERNKLVLREYYERRLRYKGAFYKDRKLFEKYGNPLHWDKSKNMDRYKVKHEERLYIDSYNLFDGFIYIGSKLIEISLRKDLRLLIIDTVGENLDFETGFETKIRLELKEMINIMERIDNRKNKIITRKGYSEQKIVDLGHLKTTFKLNINGIIRYIATPYITPDFVIEKSINTLHSYLRGLLELESVFDNEERKIRPSQDFDYDIDVQTVVLERIILSKKSNVFNLKTIHQKYRDYILSARELESIEIVEVWT